MHRSWLKRKKKVLSIFHWTNSTAKWLKKWKNINIFKCDIVCAWKRRIDDNLLFFLEIPAEYEQKHDFEIYFFFVFCCTNGCLQFIYDALQYNRFVCYFHNLFIFFFFILMKCRLFFNLYSSLSFNHFSNGDWREKLVYTKKKNVVYLNSRLIYGMNKKKTHNKTWIFSFVCCVRKKNIHI